MKDILKIQFIVLFLTCHTSSLKILNSTEILLGSKQVIRCLSHSRSELLFLHSLKSNLYYDFWLSPREIEMPVDIMAEGIHLLKLKSTLEENNIQHEVFIDDVPSAVNELSASNQKALIGGNFFEAYHTYEEIVAWMKSLRDMYPKVITLIKMGRSYEWRVMYVVKLSKNSSLLRPALWIDGGMHGREWISPAVVMYMLNELLTDETYSTLLDSMDFYFMPVMNPDGYDFTFQEGQRLWRKTRSWRIFDGLCRGVDVNRNWDFHWNGTGDPCSDNYPGHCPFSEKEMIHTKKEMMSNILHLKGYLTYHSYAQLFLFPWGYTTEHIDDFAELATVSGRAVDAIYTYGGTRYKQQQYCVDPELCTYGDSIDYLKGVTKLKYTYLIQLPDLGNYGFLLPPSEIIPVGEESLLGLVVVADAVVNG